MEAKYLELLSKLSATSKSIMNYAKYLADESNVDDISLNDVIKKLIEINEPLSIIVLTEISNLKLNKE